MLPDGFDAVLGIALGSIALGSEDNVSVHRFEPEPESFSVVVKLVFGIGEDLISGYGLVLDTGIAVESDGFDSVLCRFGAAIGLGGSYDHSVAGNKVEEEAILLLGGIHNEFCHGMDIAISY